MKIKTNLLLSLILLTFSNIKADETKDKDDCPKNSFTELVKLAKEGNLEAAKQGDAYAQHSIGFCYAHGEGVDQNVTEGKKWLQKAIAQGNESAKKELAKLNASTAPQSSSSTSRASTSNCSASSSSSGAGKFSPSGHYYRNTSDGFSITLEFNSWDNAGHIDWLGDHVHYRTFFYWRVNNGLVTIKPKAIILDDFTLRFSGDGRSLINVDTNTVYRLVK